VQKIFGLSTVNLFFIFMQEKLLQKYPYGDFLLFEFDIQKRKQGHP